MTDYFYGARAYRYLLSAAQRFSFDLSASGYMQIYNSLTVRRTANFIHIKCIFVHKSKKKNQWTTKQKLFEISFDEFVIVYGQFLWTQKKKSESRISDL